MNKKQELSDQFLQPLLIVMRVSAMLAFSGVLSAQAMAESKPAHLSVQTESKQDSASGLAALRISFKFSPRPNDRHPQSGLWISPSTFTSFDSGSKSVVEARVDGVDRDGNALAIQPEWIAADSELLTVTPGQGQTVKITVRHTGRSTLKVVAQGVSKMLSVKADSVYQSSYFKVAISQ